MTGPGTTVSVAEGLLAAPVLTRVVAALAARADLALDRVDDARLLAAALAAHGPGHARDGRLRLSVERGPGELSIRVGPLVPGGAGALLRESALPGIGPVVPRLADEVGVDAESETGEFLVLRLASPPSRVPG